MARLASPALLLVLACSSPQKSPPATAAGGTPTPTDRGVADTLAAAPAQAVPGTRKIRPPCNESGYLKLEVTTDAAFSVEVKPDKGCASAGIVDANGKPLGDPVDACFKTPKNVVGTGVAGGTFLAIGESGTCEGNVVTLTIK
ncbi:MAG TPA: hypothetical protein VFQ53_20245 [Kofleriaceae bacterium]|nr:hypothetical protein [Kofleriaceae bacterium]